MDLELVDLESRVSVLPESVVNVILLCTLNMSGQSVLDIFGGLP